MWYRTMNPGLNTRRIPATREIATNKRFTMITLLSGMRCNRKSILGGHTRNGTQSPHSIGGHRGAVRDRFATGGDDFVDDLLGGRGGAASAFHVAAQIVDDNLCPSRAATAHARARDRCLRRSRSPRDLSGRASWGASLVAIPSWPAHVRQAIRGGGSPLPDRCRRLFVAQRPRCVAISS